LPHKAKNRFDIHWVLPLSSPANHLFMKKTLLLLLTAGCLAQYACKKGEDDNTSTLSAKINGVGFTAEHVTVSLQPGYKIIKGIRDGSNQSITIIDSDTSGIYSMGIYSPDGTTADSSQSFGLTQMTNVDAKNASGEFDFVTNDSVVITDGTYNIYW
jgi:hypothetical protein